MKKILMFIALFTVLILTSSGFNENRFGIVPGDPAPVLNVTNQDGEFSLTQSRGKYVLLTFWSSQDATSRQRCHQYNVWARQHAAQNHRFTNLAVNFDTNEGLFREIVNIDNLEKKTQYYARDAKVGTNITRDFDISAGYYSMLIDRDGHVLKINPTTTELTTILSH